METDINLKEIDYETKYKRLFKDWKNMYRRLNSSTRELAEYWSKDTNEYYRKRLKRVISEYDHLRKEYDHITNENILLREFIHKLDISDEELEDYLFNSNDSIYGLL